MTGRSAREIGDHLPHRLPARQIETGGRLVEKDHRRIPDETGRQVKAATHPAGVRRDTSLPGLGQAELPE